MALLVRSLLVAGALVVAATLLLPPSSGSPVDLAADVAGIRPEPPPDAQSEAPPGQMHPGLVTALAAAQQAAAADGHDLVVTSGYRTPERQQQLLDAEIVERGSYEAATRWVFPPDRSMHVRGLAVDVGDGPAADWLAEHGGGWGICRTLDWEWWHFEWRERWEADGTCPAPALDAESAPGLEQPASVR